MVFFSLFSIADELASAFGWLLSRKAESSAKKTVRPPHEDEPQNVLPPTRGQNGLKCSMCDSSLFPIDK